MPSWLSDVRLESHTTLLVVYVLAGAALAALIVPIVGVRARPIVRFAISGVVALLGAAIGLALPYLLDLPAVFGVILSPVILGAAAGGGAGIAVALLNLVRTRWWRKVLAVVAVPLLVVAAGLMINEDVGYYPTVGDALGVNKVPTLRLRTTKTIPIEHWKAPSSMPSTGSVSKVTIPATESHFHARDAWVYLPPAARVADPPALPVVVALSGEPGAPSDVFYGGDLASTMDAVAASHGGLAPIVVVPDQLGDFSRNPMCVNSKLGQVRTYLMDDVRDWILHHLPVATSRHAWTIAGFSEGGTCASQLGAGYPAVFGSFVDVSGELAPRNGSVAHTVKVGFDGSRAAYAAASPLEILKKHRYPDTEAYFAVGAQDRRYGPATTELSAAARAAGMRVHTYFVPSYGHNWNTGALGLAWGLGHLTTLWRLPVGVGSIADAGNGPALPTLRPSERHKLK